MKPMNKKGLAFAAVVLLLAAALFVGAAAADAGAAAALQTAEGDESLQADNPVGDAAGGDGSDDAQDAETEYTLTVKEGTAEGVYHTISDALATLSASSTGSATIEIYGKIVEKDGQIKNAQEGWNYTFVGKKDDPEIKGDPVIDLSAKAGEGSHIDKGTSSLKFENLTLIFDTGAPYRGFQHSTEEKYIGCTIEGFFKTYAPKVSFEDCTFNQTTYEYHLWVYGESTTTFTNCTFNNLGKAAKIYREKTEIGKLDVTFTDCTFNAQNIPEGKGKAAIEIDSSLCSVNLTVKNCTVNGYKAGLLSGNTLWNSEPNAGNLSTTKETNVTFTITLDPNGGSLSGDSTKDITYDAAVVSTDGQPHDVPGDDAEKQKLFKIKGSAYGDLPTPTKAGASFDGWYTEKTGGTKVTAATVIKPEDAVEHTLYAHWSAPVAKIGTTTYGSLAEAVEDVPTDGTETTITMIADHTIVGNAGVTIPAGKNIILDLNGHTVQNVVDEEKASQIIDNQGTLTIKDSTDKKTDGTGKGKLMNVVEEGIQPGDWDKWNYATDVILNHGILTVESGLLEQTAGGTICYAIDAQTNSTLYTVSTTIKGGKMTSVKTAVRMFCNSSDNDNDMVVEGGTITSKEKYGLVFQSANASANKGSLTIQGGTVNGGVESGTEYESLNVWADTGSNTDNMSVDITGGVFTTKVTIDKVAPKTLSVSGGHFTKITVDSTPAKEKFITGGIFDTKPADEYIADGYEWNKESKAVGKIQEPKGGDVEPTEDDKKVPGAPEGTEIKKISGLPTDGDKKITKVTYSVSKDSAPPRVAKATLSSIDITVYIGTEEDIVPEHGNLGQPVTVTFTIPDNDYDLSKLAVYHNKGVDNWVKVANPKFEKEGALIKVTFTTDSFSTFAVVEKAAEKKSSSSSQGSSVWLTDDSAAQPTATPTPTPTPEPVATPGVKPVTPTETPAKTPAPFLGILAGLGAAAAVFGLRRK